MPAVLILMLSVAITLLESEPGRGSCFTLHLPRVARGVPGHASPLRAVAA